MVFPTSNSTELSVCPSRATSSGPFILSFTSSFKCNKVPLMLLVLLPLPGRTRPIICNAFPSKSNGARRSLNVQPQCLSRCLNAGTSVLCMERKTWGCSRRARSGCGCLLCGCGRRISSMAASFVTQDLPLPLSLPRSLPQTHTDKQHGGHHHKRCQPR